MVVAPEDGVHYEDVVASMDMVVGEGFADMSLSDGSTLLRSRDQFSMPINQPGKVLLKSVPLKFVAKKVSGTAPSRSTSRSRSFRSSTS